MKTTLFFVSSTLTLLGCNGAETTSPALGEGGNSGVSAEEADGGVVSPPTAGTAALDAGRERDAAAPPTTSARSCQVDWGDNIGISLDPDADEDGACDNGLQTELALSIDAPDGTPVVISLDDGARFESSVSDGAARVSLTLPHGVSALRAVVGSGETSCTSTTVARVTCPGESLCRLSELPPVLNGVRASDGGNRTSAAGLPYQTEVVVETDFADDAFVVLEVDGVETAQAASVKDGTARLVAELGDDGEHDIAVSCVRADGSTISSATKTVVVDTEPPGLSLQAPVSASGIHLSPAMDLDADTEVLDFEVCAATAATDITAHGQLCVSIDALPATCVAAEVGTTCVPLQCPGSAPFDLAVSLTDDGGNISTDELFALTCASASPTVRIVNLPDGTSAPEDLGQRLLAVGSGFGFEDQDATAFGAQVDVVACTNATDAVAELFVGSGASPTRVGDPVVVTTASADDGCGGLPSVARFVDITLPESAVEGAELVAPTEVRVDVIDISTERGQSPVHAFWVDSSLPNLSVSRPVGGLCDKTFRQATDFIADLRFVAGAFPVTATFNDGQELVFGAEPSLVGVSETFSITLPLGVNTFSAWAQEPSGNIVRLPAAGGGCEVIVGEPPIVAWTSPSSAAALDATTDGDRNTPLWQGELSVSVTAFDATDASHEVSFYYDKGDGPVLLGKAPVLGDESGGSATLAVTLPEGSALTLSAEMDQVDVFRPKAPKLKVAVDVAAPSVTGPLSVAVERRREASFALSFTPANDDGSGVYDYEVFWSSSPITEANVAEATEVAFEGDLLATTVRTVVHSLPMETPLYFAVRAVDGGMNRGALRSSSVAQRSEFRVSTLEGGDGDVVGSWVDGTSDIVGGRMAADGTWIQGDGIPDLLVGTWSGEARIYRGLPRASASDASPLFSATPAVTISGNVPGLFGERVVAIGDVNADGLEDFAVTGPYDGPHGQGAVFVWFGRRPADNSGSEWPARLAATSANVVIQTPGTDAWAGDCPTCTALGNTVVRLGDFDGDGIDDFAFGAYRSGTEPQEGGYVGVVLGRPTLPSYIELPSAPNATPAEGLLSIAGQVVDGRLGTGAVGLGTVSGQTGNRLGIAAGYTEELSTFSFARATNTEVQQRLLGRAHQRYSLGVDRNDYGRVMSLLAGDVLAVASPCAKYFFPCSGTTGGFVDLFYGGTSLFSASVQITHGAVPELDFGVSVIGSAVAQTNSVRRFALAGPLSGIAASDSDFAIVDQGVSQDYPSAGPSLWLVSGEIFDSWITDALDTVDITAADSGAVWVNVATKAGFDVEERPWAGTASLTLPLADMNGDGYAELVVAEFGAYDAILKGEGALTYPGRIAILW